MHFTTALITAVSTAIFAASGVQAAGNFAASCSNYYIQNNNFLWATCGDGRGGRTTSALNLELLHWERCGNYATGCSACLIHTGTYMRCQCGSGSGIADLNECVANRGGLLACA
ncbi:CVNH domain protein [Rhizoctonia solani]|uniref:CVNH domain protein n=1 Tax=Rhizoctonia solani TaxID=456999 RepID=A0A8H8P2C7_9AGAM|nr:CVNH domain protein [Rhizoctonia solani]QRW22553.1 CVNH domain protein [Rhizoctonia solani]